MSISPNHVEEEDLKACHWPEVVNCLEVRIKVSYQPCVDLPLLKNNYQNSSESSSDPLG